MFNDYTENKMKLSRSLSSPMKDLITYEPSETKDEAKETASESNQQIQRADSQGAEIAVRKEPKKVQNNPMDLPQNQWSIERKIAHQNAYYSYFKQDKEKHQRLRKMSAKAKPKKTYDNTFEYERIENSYFSLVEDQLGREVVHDECDFAIKDRRRPPSYNILRSVGREKEFYAKPHGKPDGPHENRFNRPDTFDKSERLTSNPKTKSIPNFYKTVKREDDVILKGGDTRIDIESKCHVIYDGAMDKPRLTQPKLDVGIPKLGFLGRRNTNGTIYKKDESLSTNFDNLKAAETYQKCNY